MSLADNAIFIVISGYRHFEYAQNAIKFDVEDYLLKPIDEDELIFTLKKISKKLNDFTEAESNHKKMEEQYIQNKIKLQQNLLSYLYENPEYFINVDRNEVVKKFQLSFKNGLYKVFIIKCDNKKNKNIQNLILLKKIFDLANMIYKGNTFEFIADITEYDLICLLNYSFNNEVLIQDKSRTFFQKSLDLARDYPSCYITMGIGKIVSNFSEIPDSFVCAVDSIKSRHIYPYSSLLEYEELIEEKTDISEYILNNQINNIIKLIELKDSTGIKNFVQGLFN